MKGSMTLLFLWNWISAALPSLNICSAVIGVIDHVIILHKLTTLKEVEFGTQC